MIGNGGGAKSHSPLANCALTECTGHRCPTETECRDILEEFHSFVDDAAARGSNILLSAEKFDHPFLNITQLTSVLVPKRYKVHVVVYYRRFYDWIHSFYNQRVKTSDTNEDKAGQHLTFVQWLTDDRLRDELQPMFSDVVYNRFKKAPGISNVSVVNMHEDPDKFNTIERFACDHMDNAPHLCKLAKSQVVTHGNPSKSVDWKLFHSSISIYHPIKLSDLDSRRWEKIEAKFDEMTNIPQLCLSPELQDKVLQISLEAEKALTPESWYDSEEGLEDLKADFEVKIKSKLCSIDIEKMLISPEWQNFLTDLEEE